MLRRPFISIFICFMHRATGLWDLLRSSHEAMEPDYSKEKCSSDISSFFMDDLVLFAEALISQANVLSQCFSVITLEKR